MLSGLALLTAACTGVATRRPGTVIYASGADLESANPLVTTHPLARQVQRYVLLTTLVQYDSTMHVAPALAQRWEWSRDSTRVTLHLYPALRWDDGARTTARDVAWTLDAARNPATGYPRLTDLASLRDVHVIDDSTLTLSFASRRRDFPDVLTDLAILPAHLLDTVPLSRMRSATWDRAPVGNGPFRFVSHRANRDWVFDAKPNYPAALGGPAQIRRLVIAVVDEPTTKLAALTSGELDFAGIQPAHVTFVARDPHLAVVRYPLPLSYALVFNTRRAPFDAVKVRRAVSLALDRRRVVDGYLFGLGQPAIGPLPSPADSLDQNGAPDSARRLLAGRAVSFEMLTVGSGEAALEQMIQRQLADVGVRVTIRQLELTSFLGRVNASSHDFDAAILGITTDRDDGELAPLLALTGTPHDTGIAAMRATFDSATPAAFLYRATGVQGMNRRVLNVHMDARGELASLRQWRIAP